MLLAGPFLMAQETGKVVGRVTDKASGDVLIGANVIVKPTFGAATDLKGQYSIMNVPSGIYDIEFSYIGYRTLVVKAVTVKVNKTATVDAQLAAVPITGRTMVVSSNPLLEDKKNRAANSAGKRAMTWKKLSHNPELGIDIVGCAGCNAYDGDTPVSEELPVLAIKKESLPRPPYDFGGCDNCAMPREYYYGWSGGHIALTRPIKGSELTSLQKANEYCEQQCGKGYRMAEFHDGEYVIGMDMEHYYGASWSEAGGLSRGAWNFYAYGNIPDWLRFWVYIDDQPANCWEQTTAHYEPEPFAIKSSSSGQRAKIKVDIDRTISEIDPNIYGVFMEPIQFNPRRFGVDARPSNTMYGTLYNPESPFTNKDGFDTRYIEAARELRITNMRWPGGNYVAGYHWQDGIGPKMQRPVRKELAWGALDNNHVGTDEWMKLSRALGVENVLCINMGTGTLDDARYWVEYCNSEPGSYYADLRTKYGNEKPYRVKYWCLGNEVDGEPWIMGYKNAEAYCKFAKEAAKIMKYTDKAISFVANGSSNYDASGTWIDWNLKVISELRDIADYLSIHRYWENSSDYYTYIGQGAMDVEEKITVPARLISIVRAKYKMEKPMYISFDEWGTFGRNHLQTLAIAQYFNSFIRHADVVKMANFTLLTGILDRDKDKGTFKSPMFYTFKLFSNNCRGTSLDVSVECDTFSTSRYYTNIPYLDVTCVYSRETHSLIINVVNRHKEMAIVADIISATGRFVGTATVSKINCDDILAPYTFENRDQYIPHPEEMEVSGNTMTYSFPAHSFAQIMVKIK